MTVSVTRVDWDYGDKRSYGTFEVEAETPLGTLLIEGLINSGGEAEDETLTVGGVEIEIEIEDIDLPDFGMPHYYAGSRALDRYEAVKDQEAQEILSKWFEEAEEVLKEALANPSEKEG